MQNRVRELRTERGLTQADLADSAELGERTIQRVEGGEATPRALIAIAKALDVEPAELTQSGRKKTKESIGLFLVRIASGSDLWARAADALALQSGWEEGLTSEQVELAGRLLDGWQDWMDFLEDMYPSQRMSIDAEYDALLEELDQEGLWVFGGKVTTVFKLNATPDLQPSVDEVPLRTLVTHVFRKTNPMIIKTSQGAAIWVRR